MHAEQNEIEEECSVELVNIVKLFSTQVLLDNCRFSHHHLVMLKKI